MSLDVDELDDEHDKRHDYRRANGAPIVSDPHDPTKNQRYSRPSGYAKCLDDEEALVNWRIWKAMDGVARSKALQTQITATKDDDKETKKELREKALDKGSANERADIGTGLHAMTARMEDPKDDFEPPEMYADDLACYMKCLDDYGLVSEMVEVRIVNDAFRAAGTADRIYRLTRPLVTPTGEILPIGTLVLADLKTGAKLDFSLPGYAVQTAIYAQGVLYDIVDEKRLPTPDINKSWTLLVHLPVGKAECTLLWCQVDTGVYGAWLAKEVKEWRKLWKRGDRDGAFMHDAVEVPLPSATVEEMIDETFPDTMIELSEDMVPEMVDYIKGRISTIGKHDDARKWLLLKWPEGVPSPKGGLSKPGDVVRILYLLDAVEAQFGIPFGASDPRLDRQQKLHKSLIRHDNEFMLTDLEPQEPTSKGNQ